MLMLSYGTQGEIMKNDDKTGERKIRKMKTLKELGAKQRK